MNCLTASRRRLHWGDSAAPEHSGSDRLSWQRDLTNATSTDAIACGLPLNGRLATACGAIVLLALLCVPFGRAGAEETELPLHGESVLSFASVEKGRELLGSRDEFTAELTRFDLESRLMTRDDATVERLLEHVQQQVLPWTDAERESVARALASIRPRMEKLAPDLFPDTVWLIKSSGMDEGGAAYCRGNAIVLPRGMLARPPGGKLDSLLAHELFHILSRQHDGRRRKLYRIVGFKLIEQVKLPPSLADRKITNPDAPWINCYIKFQHDGQPFLGAPLLYAKAQRYDPSRGGTFFDYMQFELLKIEADGDNWTAATDADGNPVLLDPTKNEDYFAQIGKNTRYIIHPEEIMADNFAALLTGREDLPNPEIVEELAEVLSK